jgi:hypothetical protein
MSTSLSDLPMPGQQQMPDLSGQQNFDLNNMIDEAAKQVNAGNYQNQQEDPNLSAGAIQYQLDQSQIPQNGPIPNIQIQDHQYDEQQPQYMYDMEPEQEPELSLVEKITSEVKLPLIVAVLFVILSLPQFNRVLTRFVPKLLAETGELNMMGLLAKGIILAILFFAIKHFV